MADDNAQNEERKEEAAPAGDLNAQETTEKKKEDEGAKKDFGATLRGYLDKGVAASVKALKSAGNAISDFGDTAVTNIDIAQLKSKADKKYLELGKLAYNGLLSDKAQLTRDTEGAAALLDEISDLKKKIADKEASVESIRQRSKKQ